MIFPKSSSLPWSKNTCHLSPLYVFLSPLCIHLYSVVSGSPVVPRALARGCDGVRRYNPVLEQDRKSSRVSSPAPCCSRGHTSGRHGCGDGRGTWVVAPADNGDRLTDTLAKKISQYESAVYLRFFCWGLYEFPCLVQSEHALAHRSHFWGQTNPLLLLLPAENSGKCGWTGMLVLRSGRALQHLS